MNSSFFTLFISLSALSLSSFNPTGATTCHPDDEAGLLAFKASITRDPSNTLSSWKKGTTPCCSWNGITCLNSDRVTTLSLVGDKGNNRLSGSLPDNIGLLSKLEELNLEGNRFTDSIPLGIAKLKLLWFFKLGNNRLSNTIPNIFKNMTRLQLLDLSRNEFSGKLPSSLASLAPTLVQLELNQNKLWGKIPSYLSRFKRLEKLDLSKNRFSGVVPKGFTNLIYINHLILSHNLLTDPLPVLNVNNINILDLSYNKFHLNKIPKWVTSLRGLESLDLAKCGIKMSLDEWKPLAPSYYSYIDFSENEITGSPARLMNQTEILVEFRAVGNKLQFDLEKLMFPKTLKTLDLSRNLIFGKVPATMATLRRLNLSQNHLCGKLPVTKFAVSVFSGNKCLCGSPLSPCINKKVVFESRMGQTDFGTIEDDEIEKKHKR